MQLQGEDKASVEALSQGDSATAPLPDKERILLGFVELLTRHAYRTTQEDVQRLRDVGWTDEQIAECVYITALLALFNRVADAFGLEDPAYRTLLDRGGTPPTPANKSRPN